MANEDAPKEFPDISLKLAAPKKLSAFERERLAAEEKRRENEAATAAALRDFEDEFAPVGHGDDDDDFDGFPSSARGGPRGSGVGYGGGGGGSGPPPSLKRKRALDELREQQEARREQDALTREYAERSSSNPFREFHPRASSEEHDDISTPRPTVQLSSLPPHMSEDEIRSLLQGLLPVHSVDIQRQEARGRLSISAIVTTSHDTATPQIDAAVSALKDKYLGCGYRLSISRHLSSTALQHPGLPQASFTNVEPFGAQKGSREQPRGFSMRNAPPPSDFGPSDVYDPRPRPYASQPYASVAVQPPIDIQTVRAIHTLVDRLLSERYPARAMQIEATLMQDKEVEQDERFAFLYDSSSPAGLYYRYLLWNDDDEFDSLQERKRVDRGLERIYDDIVIDWNVSSGTVPFADLSRLGEVLDHLNYESSEEDSDDDAPERRYNTGRREGEGPPPVSERNHLTPLQLAKFAWLLSRVPTTQARLRLGDIAPISNFAINNAGAGAEEIVDFLVLNLEKPFNTTQCARFDNENYTDDDEDDYEPDVDLPSIETSETVAKKESDADPSQAKLVALYLINDVLHNSTTAGVRNAWKYRQLFETAFRRQETFKHLGRLGKSLGWGRIKENQWQNKIRALFEVWEQGSLFANDVFEALKNDFYDQPRAEESEAPEGKRIEQKTSDATPASFGKWVKPFASSNTRPISFKPASSRAGESDDTPTEGNEDVPKNIDARGLDGGDDTVDKMDVDQLSSKITPQNARSSVQQSSQSTAGNGNGFSLANFLKTHGNGKGLDPDTNDAQVAEDPRRRKQAEDMFADSDED